MSVKERLYRPNVTSTSSDALENTKCSTSKIHKKQNSCPCIDKEDDKEAADAPVIDSSNEENINIPLIQRSDTFPASAKFCNSNAKNRNHAKGNPFVEYKIDISDSDDSDSPNDESKI